MSLKSFMWRLRRPFTLWIYRFQENKRVVAIQKKAKKTIDYVVEDSVRMSLALFIACLVIVFILTVYTTKQGYTSEFYENILVEAHGMLFDILILGAFVFWINKRGDKVREIKRLENELKYYIEYTRPEATFHVSKIITQLNDLGVYKLNLIRVYLEGASMLCARFEDTQFIGNWLSRAFFHEGIFEKCFFHRSECNETNFELAEITECRFIDCSFDATKFKETVFSAVQFEGCDFRSADFTEANLYSCTFINCTMRHCHFEEAAFHSCDLTGIKDTVMNFWDCAAIQKSKINGTDKDAFKDAEIDEPEWV